MRITRLFPVALLLAACEAKAPPPPPPAPPPAPTIADYAGHWKATNILNQMGDTVQSELFGATGGTQWFMRLKGRDSIPMRVTTRADSLILLSDKYQSILRKQTVVQVRAALVMSGSELNGKLVATYDAKSGQDLVTGTIHALRDTTP